MRGHGGEGDGGSKGVWFWLWFRPLYSYLGAKSGKDWTLAFSFGAAFVMVMHAGFENGGGMGKAIW